MAIMAASGDWPSKSAMTVSSNNLARKRVRSAFERSAIDPMEVRRRKNVHILRSRLQPSQDYILSAKVLRAKWSAFWLPVRQH